MSRYFSMFVRITGVAAGRVDAVKEAAEVEWPFEDWSLGVEGALTAAAEDSLCGGETDEEFALRLARAVWVANGAFCAVEVSATYLENLPYETYCFDQGDYHRLTATPKHKPSTQEENGDG